MKTRWLAGLVTLILFAFMLPAGTNRCLADSEHRHEPIPEEEIQHLGEQVVEIDDIAADGHILAIGGGGEGVIGQLKGSQVIAIDISRRELENAPGDALKIVMDARELGFVDESFDTATSFFTLMYIDGADHAKVFEEVFRVLRPGGRFLVWDTVFGERPEGKTVGVVSLTIKLPAREISTGYGVRWPEEPHDLPHYKRLAAATGFKLTEVRARDQWFYLEVQKPER